MFGYKRLMMGLGVLFLIVALLAVGAGAAKVYADASAHASCLGIESSSISPPGSTSEEVGGRAQLAHELKEAGGPPGAIVSSFAQVHAGSHEACDSP